MSKVLDLEMRRRIVDLVRAFPGLHTREVARQLDTSVTLVEYHLPILLDAGLLTQTREDRYQRLFPADRRGLTETDRRKLGLLRDRTALHVTLHLLDRGTAEKHGDISAALGIGKSRLSFHLRKLEAADLVRKDAEGFFVVVDRRGTLRLLVENRPTPDLQSSFAELWSKLYG